jgi:hypothetical protein
MTSDSLQTVIDSLIKVANSNSNDSLALYIAGLAIVVSAIVQIWVAIINKKQFKEQTEMQTEMTQKQIHASTVTANRKEWINTVRDTVAEYVSVSNEFYLTLSANNTQSNRNVITSTFPKVSLLQNKIKLLLNPEEEKSLIIISKLKEATNNILSKIKKIGSEEESGEGTATKLGVLLSEIVNITIELLREENNKIERGE